MTTLVSNIYPVVKTWINAMNEAAHHSFLVLPISLSLYRTVESSSSKALRCGVNARCVKGTGIRQQVDKTMLAFFYLLAEVSFGQPICVSNYDVYRCRCIYTDDLQATCVQLVL